MSGWPARPPCHRIPGYDPRRAWPRACAPPPRRARGRTPEARRPPAPPAPCPGPTPASGAGPHRCHSAHSGADTPHTVQRHPGPAVPARPAPGRVRRTRHPPRPSSPHPAGHAIPWRCARRSPFICSGPLAAQNLCENGVLPQAAPDGTHGWVRRAANPEANIVVAWSAEAGPKVVTTIIDGGPKLGVDTPIDDMGFPIAWNVGTFGGGHPLLAAGVLAVSAAVNGASYLMNRGQNQAKQAALNAEYVQFSRDRLSKMSRRYSTLLHQFDSARIRRTSAKERIRLETLLSITEFALHQVRAAPGPANSVVLTKGTPPKVV